MAEDQSGKTPFPAQPQGKSEKAEHETRKIQTDFLGDFDDDANLVGCTFRSTEPWSHSEMRRRPLKRVSPSENKRSAIKLKSVINIV